MDMQNTNAAKASENGTLYHIVTYGCQMNEHESQKIASQLEEMGYTYTPDKEQAGLLVFNTCCVRENAENKIIGNIGAIKGVKEKNNAVKVVVCGCMTQQETVADKVFRTFPFVDVVIGTHNISRLPELLRRNAATKKRQLELLEAPGQPDGVTHIKRAGAAALVNIMYGCDNFCSYCIVPFVRGSERSRSPEVITEEIKNLVSRGVQEVTLLGQNVNSYGRELGLTFAQLLESLCRRTDIRRIRFMTSHPKDLSDELIAAMAANPQICKHIHLPVQSGSSRILAGMNRKYSREEYLLLIHKLRAAMPDIAITTDIIAGFPGETEEDFLQTLDLVRSVRFEAAFTFVYSRRSGTAAADMGGQLSASVKKYRIIRLVALQNAVTEEINKAYEGTLQTVLAEGTSTRNRKHLTGRADGGKTVNFAGNDGLVGQFVNVRITQGKKTTLFGRIEGTTNG